MPVMLISILLMGLLPFSYADCYIASSPNFWWFFSPLAILAAIAGSSTLVEQDSKPSFSNIYVKSRHIPSKRTEQCMNLPQRLVSVLF